ncbi:vitamin k-dependent protein c isoform 1 [Diplodia corticola]|uniref:Vitamin k-dependent protein c isoform 1 n=1 Tax=Diplodia corticola TaxID=236234 RepID=A0A1J9S0X8_9PEZI|nr:vitamin k-dependent protein c isoform 1 [Diplodia corticola]OJD34239.1 vitamin k-dependent protein c isoform 1 [Diplodia corticola]
MSRRPSSALHAPQGIDPRLLSIMDDDRYSGDLSSQASPCTSLAMPTRAPQDLPVTPTTAPLDQYHMPVDPSFILCGQINPVAATPTIANNLQCTWTSTPHIPPAAFGNGNGTGQFTANFAQTPLDAAGYGWNNGQLTPNVDLTSLSAVGNGNGTEQFAPNLGPSQLSALGNAYYTGQIAPNLAQTPLDAAGYGWNNGQLTPNVDLTSLSAVGNGYSTEHFTPNLAQTPFPAFGNGYSTEQLTPSLTQTSPPAVGNGYSIEQLTPNLTQTSPPAVGNGYSTEQFTPNLTQTPLHTAGYRWNTEQLAPCVDPIQHSSIGSGYSTRHPTSYTPQHQSAAVRTKPTPKQFRFNPYPWHILSTAASKESNKQHLTSYTSRAPHPVVPTKSNIQQLTPRATRVSPAVVRTKPLRQQLGPYTANNQPASPAAHPVTHRLNHLGAEKPVAFITISPGSERLEPRLSYAPLQAQPPPQTPARTENRSIGLSTPEKTPTTNKPANKNLSGASAAFPSNAVKKKTKHQPAAVNAPLRQGPTAQIRSRITSQEACSLENPSYTPFEASLMSALEAEIKVLDKARNEKARAKWNAMQEWMNNYMKKARDNAMKEAKDNAMKEIAKDNAMKEAKAKDGATKELVSEFEIGKQNARKDIGSEVYHTYVDSTGFAYHDICLTRVDLTNNTNERVLLSIYETDFCPHNYVTYVGIHGPGTAFKSEILANGTDYKSAFLEFRKAFKKYTRVSWEARLIPQNYIAERVRVWEKLKIEQKMFERINEQPYSGSKPRGMVLVAPEDVLTREELESCLVKRYKYTAPAAGKPQGETRQFGGLYPVVPGDEPNDGGWTLVAS